jgi:hypothetical protein
MEVYGDSSPSFLTIKKWAAKFKRGRTRLEDDPREGRPKINAVINVLALREIMFEK